ncbi:hypothetical protein GQX73_g9519 [Xylaria multiplex]|uniref:LysM domain-containing protein n=1 Tax=Xylaria multiplex TaxID=323545 RepID=A0A7C8IHU8_9PEZI|nr:hypothetical protein GQX73_g9519 [Xylaria multiplex]
MLAQALLSIVAFATQGFTAPTMGFELVARQGYTANCTATYTVQSGDVCNAIRDRFNDVYTLAEFYSWNPQVDSFCSNLYPGEVVCVGVGNSTGAPPACPVPVKPGLISNCNSCHKVVSGDSCSALLSANNITLAELRAWNPDLDSGCSNLVIGFNYCVGVSDTLV